MKLRLGIGSLLALAAASLFIVGFADHANAQLEGVRIIRESGYFLRPAHYLSSNLYTTLATERETGNRFVSFDFQVTPGGGPLPHTHSNEWETFFVHEGQVTFTVGVDPVTFMFIDVEIPAGTVVYGPQGPVHGFVNNSGAPARIFSFAMPGGLHNFFVTSGDPVRPWNRNDPIPPITQEEILRTAFWAEQRGDALHFPGTPPPDLPPGTPADVISSITDPARPRITGPFGEERVRLLTPEEVGNITGATAFCGPGAPGRPGGTVDYSYFSLPQQADFPPEVTSNNVEVYYTLGGVLSFKFGDITTTAAPLTYVEIQPGVSYAVANLESEPGESLAISVIAPTCPPPPTGPMADGR
jgi:mannose-6-phosphate isomerase-like protein (cupin superfamily)